MSGQHSRWAHRVLLANSNRCLRGAPQLLQRTVCAALLWIAAVRVLAGGSGLNTVVVVNQNSANSCEVGNYYCEKRHVPPENLLRINWTGGNISWAGNEFQTTLLNPLLAALTARQLTNQIDYIVLSMDLPFRTVNGSIINSTTSVLFYGLKTDTGLESLGVTNSYNASEQIFSQAKPASASGYSFLCTMLTGDSVAQVKHLIDQGVAGDGVFPWQPVLLAKTSDPFRNFRYPLFDNAIFNTRLCRNYPVVVTNCDSFSGQTNLFGIQTGLYQFSVSPNSFVPGAITDNLTSSGGVIFGYNDQTTLMAFINAGASASYGTVIEPGATASKFPDPQIYFWQQRGFNIAECYYQSVRIPYQGLIVGEPLSASYQLSASSKWHEPQNDAVLNGNSSLRVSFGAADLVHPLQQADLFVDGKYSRTLTNLMPRAGNTVTVRLNGYPLSYAVPSNATIASVASELSAVINDPANTNVTKVTALPHGDRVELRYIGSDLSSEPSYLLDNVSRTWSSRLYRTVSFPQPTTPSVRGVGRDPNGVFRLHAETPWSEPFIIMASSDLTNWTPVVTNYTGDPLDYVDFDAAGLPQRFYRVLATVPDERLRLAPLGQGPNGGFRFRAQTDGPAYIVQGSTNLLQWSPVFTNQYGGPMEFEDTSGFPSRFYRALRAAPNLRPPGVTFLTATPDGSALLRLPASAQGYVVQVSSNLSGWVSVFTNSPAGQFGLSATSDKGVAAAATTIATPARETFMESSAGGLLNCYVTGIIDVGTWLQLSMTSPDGVVSTVTVTNQTINALVPDLVDAFIAAIRASPDFTGSGGVSVEDLFVDAFGGCRFSLRSAALGLKAARTSARLNAYPSLLVTPNTSTPFTNNLSDLQPRNHLYVSAGARNLELKPVLDTTTLSDGFHELTVVAYEGTHVRSQTRATLSIQIQNRSLSAVMTLLDVPTNAPVQGTYHIQVTANTNNVTAIRLFSTGGQLNVVSNQPSALFTINGADLGVGLHPFYALVETANGPTYRTASRFVRFTP